MDGDIINHNPMLKKPIMAVLSLCGDQGVTDRAQLEQAATGIWRDSYAKHPSAVVDILIRNGALVQQTFVDGEPYAGTLEDMQTDPTVADDAVPESRINITAEGARLLSDYAAENLLAELLAEKPHYADVFIAALGACDAREGCSRETLEAAINERPQLKPDGEGHIRVYPQYFIDALETAGGIEWEGAWRTTDAGRAALLAG